MSRQPRQKPLPPGLLALTTVFPKGGFQHHLGHLHALRELVFEVLSDVGWV